MINTVRNLWRLFVIARTLARYDALFLLERLSVTWPLTLTAKMLARRKEEGRPGQRLAGALRELGPTFIKLGQALSTRADLIGDQVAADLAELQDKLEPFDSAEAKRIIEEEFGESIEVLYASFDEKPVAAASIAQVHFAVTNEGREVAVKILRPGIEQKFERDISLFYWLAELIDFTQPSLRRLKLVEAVRTFEESVTMEMDLRFEAAAAAELADNFAGDPTFRVPEIDWQRTSQRVMTQERVMGIPVDEREALIAAGHDLDSIMVKAAESFFNQVFRDGFFHADLHPGNLFVDAEGNLVAVDFGIMGRVDEATRRHLGEMLLGFLTGDYRRVARVHFDAGWVPADQNIDLFTQACRSIGQPILGRELHEISIGRLLGQLFQVTETFEMETQPQLLLLQKSMLVAEGIGRILNPRINMWQLAQPLIEQWMRDNLGPEARMRETMGNVLLSLERLPKLLADTENVAGLMSHKGVRLHPDSVKALTRERRRSLTPNWLPWVLVAVLLALVVLR
ncbi:2-polyprenylphenol 6-hydroxylase [Telmatospirillum sp. J64-1]|uniref:2-polyprenylphenol 6-hydroxylase n=1 Tax=Telmatospirillum sp. J64-1 TaxID=2502183 RepID=UPI00115E9B4A|nr:2-polyprenylphenol 6-hydroxylase [Telmatospirillum sp. J64-1]